MTIELVIRDARGVEITASSVEGDRPVATLTGLAGWVGAGPGIRVEKVMRIRDGALPARVRREGRALTVDVTALLEDRASTWAYERSIAGLFSDGGQGLLLVAQDTEVLSAAVQLDSPAKIDTNTDNCSVVWQLGLYAPDPRLYGPPRTMSLTPRTDETGLQYPLTYPLSYGSTSGDPAGQLTNNGNTDAYPSFQVNGDFASGFRISMSGRTIEWPWAVVPQSPVLIDMRGRCLVGGVDQRARLSRREWTSVPPGQTATAIFEPIQANGTGFCNVTICDTYI